MFFFYVEQNAAPTTSVAATTDALNPVDDATAYTIAPTKKTNVDAVILRRLFLKSYKGRSFIPYP